MPFLLLFSVPVMFLLLPFLLNKVVYVLENPGQISFWRPFPSLASHSSLSTSHALGQLALCALVSAIQSPVGWLFFVLLCFATWEVLRGREPCLVDHVPCVALLRCKGPPKILYFFFKVKDLLICF